MSCNYRKVEREADALLKAAGLPTLDHAGAEFEKLCRRLLKAKIEYARIETDKWEGRDSYQRPARGAWCERQGYIPDESNPVKGLAPAKKQARKLAAPPRPFTDEELMKVFGSSDFKKQREKHPERYWLSLICCFRYADATSSTVKSSSTKCCHRTNERPRIYARGERHGFVTPAC